MEDKELDILEIYKYKVRYAGQKNPIVKQTMALIENTKPNPGKLFVLEGIWAFNMALRAGLTITNFLFAPECVYSPEATVLAAAFCEKAEYINILSKKVFMSISERDEPDGLIAIARFPKWDLQKVNKKNSIVLILDGLEIPGNIGTIIRSADAANIDAIFICNRKARLTHPKLIKGSMGAVFFKPVIEFESVSECQEWLRANRFTVYLADTRAERGYHEYSYEGNTALVMGSERYGINRRWYAESTETGDAGVVNTKMLSIPMLGQCDSLNVAIATTVILYEMRLKKDGFKK